MKPSQTQRIQLRDYQAALIQGIYENWKTAPKVMAALPTGGGKTVIFSAVADEFVRRRERVLVLAHREELITQAAAKLESVTGAPVGIIKSGYAPAPMFPIQVASVQTMINRLNAYPDFSLVVIDEAHHSAAESYRKILGAYDGAYLLGVTATPIRTDGQGFRDLYDALVTGPTVGELIKAGHLSRFKIFADAEPMNTDGAKTVGGDFSTGDIAKVNDVVQLSGNLIEAYRHYCPGLRCLVFAVNVAHSQAIAARYSAEGIPAVHLDGETPAEERKAALRAFSEGKIKVISNCALFGEGLDIPALEAVQIARPTKSLGLWLQMVGRALRPAPGKDYAAILDHTDNWVIHGSPTRKRIWTLDGAEQEDQPLERAENGEVVPAKPRKVIEAGAALTEIQEETGAAMDWWRWWEMIGAIQKAKGYNRGWLYYQVRDAGAPLKIWLALAASSGRSKKWARYQFDQYSRHPKPAPPPIPSYLHSFLATALKQA